MKFVQKNFLFFYTGFELLLLIYAINGRGKKIGIVIQKIDIVLPKRTMLSRVNFQNSEWAALSPNDHIDCILDPVLNQQRGNFEAAFGGNVGNYWRVGA